MTTCINTLTGKSFDFRWPSAEMVDILDIAHGLAAEVRWAGQTKRRMTVVQHSIMVSEICDPRDALAGLLHDASEAYTGDFPTPLKQMCPELQEVENRIQDVIFEAFGLKLNPSAGVERHRRLKVWDEIALATEARDLFPAGTQINSRNKVRRPLAEPLRPWGVCIAGEFAFLERYLQLATERLVAEEVSRIEAAMVDMRAAVARSHERQQLLAAERAFAEAEGSQGDAICGESQVP
jgi:hypothetical protein